MQRYQRVHFVGIGGVGMSGIAEVVHTLGYVVSGSDQADSPTTRRLAEMGIRVMRGHDAEHVADVDVVVTSSAIHADNPELLAAREQRTPIVPRAEMLGELMRFRRGIAVAGTHGKTTTTSLVASVLAEGGFDPTFVIGGRLNSAGANARLGSGEFLVAEADESDGSFLLLSPVIAIITNIDADHLENYGGDFARVRKAFNDFVHRLPFYGLAVVCADDPELAALIEEAPRRIISYGLGDTADVRATNLRADGMQTGFNLHLPDVEAPIAVTLNLPGEHNVLNALAAICVGWQVGIEPVAMAMALEKFEGVGRRFHARGELAFDGGSAMLVDDYAHHPRELAAVIAAARGGWPNRRLVLAFQPHRYTRTRDLLDDFARELANVDVLILTDVYPAGEEPIAGADSRALARAVRAHGKVEPVLIAHPRDLQTILPSLLVDDDLLMMTGAGDIGATAADLANLGRLEMAR
ncbi:MAG: UDP-N-acetylmuramate--L-alanine ligase [Dokdonella sp.]